MIFKLILIGCSTDITSRAEEINAFVAENLGSGDHLGSTILFYSPEEDRNELLRLVPTESVKLVCIARYQPETILEALQTVEKEEETDLYLFPSGYAGSELAVRWAFRTKGSSLVHVSGIECRQNQLIAKKKVYSDYLFGTFRLNKKPYCISPVRASAGSVPVQMRRHVIVGEHDLTLLCKDQFIKASRWSEADTTASLEKSKFILIGGRGMGNEKNTANLRELAGSLGADFGVTRPAAMNAWAPMDKLVGVSGAVTKPEVCIVAGASGAPAFYAGIEKSKYIVAINTDSKAPIMRSSDVAVVDDYKPVLDELVKLMKA